jgi:exopolyphosphatase/guanosine-5'-triphosphate,3'-diphosphate pyrophosphatase
MRLAVLDVGSNTIHLQIMDVHRGSRPVRNSKIKTELRLIDFQDENGNISSLGKDALIAIIQEAVSQAKHLEVDEFLAFATSALREATNGLEIIDEINRLISIDLQVLSGEDEAKFTFLAVRRWFGWSSGDLLVVDVGGGSLELAAGVDELPEIALSFPVGASRMTKQFLQGDPFTSKRISMLQDHLTETLAPAITIFAPYETYRTIGTSKTIRTLARLTSEFLGDPSGILMRKSLDSLTKKLIGMSVNERAQLPRVSSTRADQLVAGAILVQHTMNELSINVIEICPWALREGIVLHRIDNLKNRA